MHEVPKKFFKNIFAKETHANGFCEQCGKKFNSLSRFKDHMRWHAKEDIFKCTECGIPFSSKGGLQTHIKVIHLALKRKQSSSSSKDCICDVCGKAFYKEATLKNHLQTHDETLTKTFVQCPICPKKIPKISLNKHVKRHERHEVLKVRVKCDICGLEMTKETLKHHRKKNVCKFRLAKKPEPGSCTTVDTGSTNISSLSSDTVKKVESMPKTAIDSSKSKIKSTSQINQAQASAPLPTSTIPSPTQGNSASISKCVTTESTNSSVKKRKHRKKIKNPCDTIATVKPTKPRLPNSLNISYSEDDCKCWKCGKFFETDGGMEKHFKEDHDGFRPFKCTYGACKSTSWRRGDSRKHIYLMHLTEEEKKPFQTIQCHICEKRFGYFETTRLKVHIMNHNNLRPFACPKCNLGFSEARVLRHHIDHVHEKKVAGKCNICGKEFTRAATLRTHVLKLHTGSFSCHICTVRKATKEEFEMHLNFHKRRFEWVEPKEGHQTNQNEEGI